MAINQGFKAKRKEFGIEVQGIEEVQKNLASLAEEYGRDVAKAAVAGAELVRGEAIKSIQSVSAGERVTRYRNTDGRSEEHTSELQSRPHLVCRLLLEKKKKKQKHHTTVKD